MRIALALLILFVAADVAHGRDPHAVVVFRKTHPCPSTGQHTGACPGYVVDHIIPLSGYGPDRPDNMQWQTVADAKIKDKLEYEAYRARIEAEKKICPRP